MIKLKTYFAAILAFCCLAPSSSWSQESKTEKEFEIKLVTKKSKKNKKPLAQKKAVMSKKREVASQKKIDKKK